MIPPWIRALLESYGLSDVENLCEDPMNPMKERLEAYEENLPSEEISGAIRAWRGWRLGIDDNGVVLQSTARSNTWPTPRMEADGPPDAGIYTGGPLSYIGARQVVVGHHGLYSLKPLAAAKILNRYAVTGEIDIYGKVVEHSLGYRSEYAVIRKFHVHPRTMKPEIMEVLSDRYDCEVETELAEKLYDFYVHEFKRQQQQEEEEKQEREEEEKQEREEDESRIIRVYSSPEARLRAIIREELRKWTSESHSESSKLSQLRQMFPQTIPYPGQIMGSQSGRIYQSQSGLQSFPKSLLP